jgi:hypothetical protein
VQWIGTDKAKLRCGRGFMKYVSPHRAEPGSARRAQRTRVAVSKTLNSGHAGADGREPGDTGKASSTLRHPGLLGL